MAHDVVTVIDEHTVVSCSVAEAEIHFTDPAAVAAWFGARYETHRTTIDAGATRIEFLHRPVQWQPEDRAVVAEGTVSGLSFYGYVTLRGVIRVGAGRGLHEVTEIWAHVELSSRPSGVAGAIRAVLRRGLHHLRSELDVAPG